jgi:hypothetical protein
VKLVSEPTLKVIAREVAGTVRKDVTIDWANREDVRAQLRVLVRRIVRKYGYPPGQAGIRGPDRPQAGRGLQRRVGAARGGVGKAVEPV